MNREEIMKIIPHRDPFLLVDHVEELIEGKSIRAVKEVRSDEYYFEGHFPGQPIMPGVLIVESLAQAGAIAVLSMEQNRGKIAFFGGAKDIKFRQKVVPGDKLILEVNLDKMRSNIGTGNCKAYVGDKLACKCSITFAIGE